MSSDERQQLQEDHLQQEIAELRGELGETVEVVVHKADLPARVKERGAELAEQAFEGAAEGTDPPPHAGGRGCSP
jgi:hypothetical protein